MHQHYVPACIWLTDATACWMTLPCVAEMVELHQTFSALPCIDRAPCGSVCTFLIQMREKGGWARLYSSKTQTKELILSMEKMAREDCLLFVLTVFYDQFSPNLQPPFLESPGRFSRVLIQQTGWLVQHAHIHTYEFTCTQQRRGL